LEENKMQKDDLTYFLNREVKITIDNKVHYGVLEATVRTDIDDDFFYLDQNGRPATLNNIYFKAKDVEDINVLK
jgi:hypothetical protein